MKVDKSKLKATGMIAIVIAVVGVTFIIANSSVDLTKGVSADLGDLAGAGGVTVMSRADYDTALTKLTEYFREVGDQTTQDTLVTDVVKILTDVQK